VITLESEDRAGHLDDGDAAGLAVLIAKPPEDAAGGVPLLLRGFLIALEDLVGEG
jgi:hypothetical protein